MSHEATNTLSLYNFRLTHFQGSVFNTTDRQTNLSTRNKYKTNWTVSKIFNNMHSLYYIVFCSFVVIIDSHIILLKYTIRNTYVSRILSIWIFQFNCCRRVCRRVERARRRNIETRVSRGITMELNSTPPSHWVTME